MKQRLLVPTTVVAVAAAGLTLVGAAPAHAAYNPRYICEQVSTDGTRTTGHTCVAYDAPAHGAISGPFHIIRASDRADWTCLFTGFAALPDSVTGTLCHQH